MSYSVYIVDDEIPQQGICRTVLAYRNALENAFVSGGAALANYPLTDAFDHSYNTEYAPAGSTQSIILFEFSGAKTINYFAVISKNAQESGVSFTVDVLVASTGIYETVAGFGSMTNGVPSMTYFGNYSALAVRVTIDYTATPYIMSMFCGEAIVFPRTLSIGAQPGHLSNIDEVEIFYADEGLNIAPSRRLSRGYQLKGAINYVKMSTIEQFWREYSDHVKGVKTIFLMWNDKLPEQVIYGVQIPDRLTKPAYKTSLFSQVDFDLVGWA
jgi:hypothetical protein